MCARYEQMYIPQSVLSRKQPFDESIKEQWQPGITESGHTWHTQKRLLRGFTVARTKEFQTGNSCWGSSVETGFSVKTANSAQGTQLIGWLTVHLIGLLLCHSSKPTAKSPQGEIRWEWKNSRSCKTKRRL